MSQSAIRWEKDADNIVTLTIDDPNQSANTMNALYQKSMGETIQRLQAEKADIKGIILTSGKKTFFAGGDLDLLMQVTPEHAAEFQKGLDELNGQRRWRCRPGGCGASATGRRPRPRRRRRSTRS